MDARFIMSVVADSSVDFQDSLFSKYIHIPGIAELAEERKQDLKLDRTMAKGLPLN